MNTAEFSDDDDEGDIDDTLPLVADFGNSDDSEPEFDDLKSRLDQFLYEEGEQAGKKNERKDGRDGDTEERMVLDPPRAESKLEDAFADFDTISADIGTT